MISIFNRRFPCPPTPPHINALPCFALTPFSVKSTASEPVSVISAPNPQSPSQALHFPSVFTTLSVLPLCFTQLPASHFDNWASAINILCGAATAIAPPHPSNDSDPNTCVENAHDLASSASPETVPAAGQQQEQDIIMLPDFVQLPVSDTPPLSVEQQYLSFSSDMPSSSDTQCSSSVSGSSSAGADDESVSNQAFSDDEDDLDDRSPAPSTARRTSIFKNPAPISDLANPETVPPSRLHSIYGTRSSTPNTSRPTLTLKGR